MQSTDLAIGDFVRCSDGTPPPPAHHQKKLRHWQCNNFTGWINKIDPGISIGIDKTGSGVLVNIMRFGEYTFTKETPPATTSPSRTLSLSPTRNHHPTMHQKSTSPWGKVDQHTPFGDLGLHHHHTPGHGGIYVPPEMLRLMPKPYRDANGYAGRNWFEEDAEWSLVALSFPSGLTDRQIELATRTVKNCYPHAYMAVSGEKLTREDSRELAEEEDRESAKDKHVVVSAWGSWCKDRSAIPCGMVGCFAVLGGRNPQGGYDESTARYLLVPEVEYDQRSSFGFIIEKDYPAWPKLGEEIPTTPTPKRIDPARAARALAMFD